MIHPKAALIERLQREGRGRPQFVTEREGPEHEPLYRSQVSISGRDYGEGSGSNKREAERRAAEAAMARLDAEVAQSAGKGSEGRAKRRRKGAGGTATSEPSPPFEDEPPALLAIPFQGPWPLYPELLAETLRIAHARVDADLRGDVALAGIEAFALRLYKDALEDLGEVVSAD
jgi:ribonuclease III